jgi:molecular chaperone DnaK (HSP70)
MELGIDFGTTRTVVAVSDRGNFPIVGFEDSDGDLRDHFPSVVATDGTQLLYGHEAAAKLEEPGWKGLRSFKRLLGRPDAPRNPIVRIGGLKIRLDELLAGFLSALRGAIAQRSNCPVPIKPDTVLHTFVAVPARSGSAQRFLTIEAFRAAGFEVTGMLNEPSAAGVEYAHRYGKTLTAARPQVLVYDLGGGTFDVSLVDMVGGEDGASHTVLENSGVNDLGGDDFDALLLRLALAQIGPQHTDRTVLLERCRAAKEGITPTSRRVTIDLDDSSVSVATADYYEAAAPLIDRSIDTIGDVLAAGTGDERFDTSQLAGVYVVGGGSDLPIVTRRLKEVFGRRVKRSANASGATAVGLAIAAASAGPTIKERFSRTFGVFRELAAGTDVTFDPILTRDTAVVREGTEWTRRYRPAHNVGHFRFAECDRLDAQGVPVGDLVPWGEMRIPFDPRLRSAQLDDVVITRTEGMPLFEERYHVDDRGIVSVRVTDLESGWAHEQRL